MTSVCNETSHEELKICLGCIREEYLRSEIERDGKIATCDYCHCRKKSMLLTDLANRVEVIIENHFCRTATEPNHYAHNWERDGQPIQELIADISQINEVAASAVLHILQQKHFDKYLAEIGEEGPFDEGTHYDVIGVDDTVLQKEWQRILRSLQQESRLFNQPVEGFLQNIFSNLDKMTTKSGASVVVTASPETKLDKLFRARVFHSERELTNAMKRPDKELGPPPSHVAGAGRMNSRGVAVFYGATDSRVALAETRPPVGSSVLIGCFCIIRPLRLIDISALEEVVGTENSYFDPAFHPTLQKHAFLDQLSKQMTLPVMPGDEASDYLVTQAVAEFLASRKISNYDGIIYPSVQSANARNIVLFHKSARVQELQIPVNTEINARCYSIYEEGPEPDYAVLEEVPPDAVLPIENPIGTWGMPEFSNFSTIVDDDRDAREPATCIDVDSLHVHIIESVVFITKDHHVSRKRIEKLSPSNMPF